MNRPVNDPFFAELKSEIQAGLAEADRGEVVEEEEVWRSAYAAIDEAARRRAATPENNA
jgi:predicted transcriptional regulator